MEKKAANPNYSYRLIAGKIEMDHGLIIKVLQGKRHISTKKIDVFADLIGLSTRQREYFRLLVMFGKATTNEDRKHYFEKLLAFSEITEKQVDSTNYEFYQHWYYTAVREILNFIDFKDDYKTLSELVNPPISMSEAKKAVKLLCRLGMIKPDDQGVYRLTEKFVTTGVQWQSIAIRSYQKEACGLAAEAIDKTPKELRDISTVTLSVNEEGVKRISDVLSRVRHELIEIAASCDKVDRAYQINLQFFPVSKIADLRQEGHDK
jgi:uncharacterized protein (TIGR02147 family)